jgi:hypothetical protein
MHWLWKSFFSPRARFTRLGMTLIILAVIGWVTFDTIHDHVLPDLKHVAEFLVISAGALYGIDKAAGHMNNRNSRKE